MDAEQVVQCLTYLGQLDPRVEANPATSDLWFYAIEALPMDEVIWNMREHYATANPNSNHGVPALTPASLKHRVASARERSTSKQRALEPPPRAAPAESYRERNPEQWDALVIKGRDDHRANLARMGIPLTAWQTASDPATD